MNATARDPLLWPRRWKRLPCNETYPTVSAIVQAFGDGANARQLAARLHASTPGIEVIVNDDSRRDHEVWLRELSGPRDFVLSSPNLHETRAYNRLARFARGTFLLLLQGDHCLPRASSWLHTGLGFFERFPRLGLIGGQVSPLSGRPLHNAHLTQVRRAAQMGFDEVPFKKIAESISWGAPPCRPIPSRVAAGGGSAVDGVAFRFVAGVNIGPLLVRRSAFLQAGGFDEAFSCAGEPGIQLDLELSLQLWRRGHQVGVWYSGASNGVGGRKTRSNPVQFRLRQRNDNVNGRRCQRLLARESPASAVAAANALLEPLGADASATRTRELEIRGLQHPRSCTVEP
jgi:GT2 family glycosyltransferase